MAEASDMDLLREYVRHGAEPAFAELVERHLNLVYSAALRHVGIAAQAEEIAQAVFIILARKAATLRDDTILEAWLYETTRLTAIYFLRGERRRQFREQEAYMQSTLGDAADDSSWAKLAPLLDEAMAYLARQDREIVVLRFFKNKSLREASAVLGISEAAAQKRAGRAVEKLRVYFAKRGVAISGGVLIAAISAHSVKAAPAALAKTVAAVAAGKGFAAAGSSSTIVKGALKIMAWSNAKTAAVSAVIIGLAGYSLLQHHREATLRADVEALQQQVAGLHAENTRLATAPRVGSPHLPAPQVQITPAPATLTGDGTEVSNVYSRFKDKTITLKAEQLESYLTAHKRDAASLLAAFRTSQDMGLLREAMERFPNDPQVAFEAVLSKQLSTAEQRQWLDAFKKNAPDNALANYLSAHNYLAAGQMDQAVQELSASAGKSFQDYSMPRVQDDVEAYLAAGYSMLDSKALAYSQLMLPQLRELRDLGRGINDLANAYQQAGDSSSTQAALLMGASLGQRYAYAQPGEAEISQLVGMAIEREALQKMNPGDPYGAEGQTVQDRINQIMQERAALKQLNDATEPLMSTISDQDWMVYKDRWVMFGEQNALQWVVNKYGAQK